jgi:hypothetical protein
MEEIYEMIASLPETVSEKYFHACYTVIPLLEIRNFKKNLN